MRLFGHGRSGRGCPVSEQLRKPRFRPVESAYDPARTFHAGNARLSAVAQGEFQMRRALLICAVLAVFSPKYTDAAGRVWRLGVLSLADGSAMRSVVLPYLATRGFVEGRNLHVD